MFDSRLEAKRGVELKLLEQAGEISELEYQVKFALCEKPKITVTIDFCYMEKYIKPANLPATSIKNFVDWVKVYEDTKGILTRDSRTKYAWLKEKYGIEVKLVREK